MLENNTINNNIESNTKNKEEDEQMKQQDTRTIFKRIDNLKKAKILLRELVYWKLNMVQALLECKKL